MIYYQAMFNLSKSGRIRLIGLSVETLPSLKLPSKMGDGIELYRHLVQQVKHFNTTRVLPFEILTLFITSSSRQNINTMGRFGGWVISL